MPRIRQINAIGDEIETQVGADAGGATADDDPGIGRVIASALLAIVQDVDAFASGRSLPPISDRYRGNTQPAARNDSDVSPRRRLAICTSSR
jgi:hypothetical protein